MIEVISRFEERVREVDLYFEVLEKLYQPGTAITTMNAEDDSTHTVNLDPDFLKILKANSFLLIYNVVESGISEGILAIYHELEANNYSVADVREEIRQLWINYHYSNVYDPSANYASYREQARRLVDLAIQQSTIQLGDKVIGINGNLDADQIRILCDLHGIDKSADPASRGGAQLEIVKAQRNALAHGSLSFVECGRQFTDVALVQIKNESVLFVKSILRNMQDYLDNKMFEAAYGNS